MTDLDHRAMHDRRYVLKAACALLASAWPIAGAAEPPPETTRIRIQDAPIACFAPLYLAEALLKSEGFSEVDYVKVPLAEGPNEALAAGRIDIAQNDTAAVPILSQIPIIGNLFKSKGERKERTELLVLVTPRLVRPLNPDEVPPLPTLPGQFLPEDEIGAQLQGGGGVVDAPAMRAGSTAFAR